MAEADAAMIKKYVDAIKGEATGTGKLKMYHPGHRHNLGIKTAKRKRALRKGNYVASARMNDLKRMLPYS